MENISITTYRGLSLVSGSISIRQMFEFIRGDVYRDRIRRLREAMDAGETVKADHMKKQLPYCTITATYAKERLAYSLDKYQDIITLDCDDMPAEKIPEFRQLVNDCPDTLGSFVSPRMHGLKIFVYLTGNEAETLRTELNALGTVDFLTLERYHHRIYALASSQYEKLLNTKVDTSGSDPGRGFFVSHDPDAFLSTNNDITTVSLLKNTKKFRIIMQMLDDSSIHVDDYDFRIISPNGRYNHENGLLGDETDEKVEYTAYHTEDDPETGAIAELNTLRLMTDTENRLVITHKSSGNVILDIPLNKYLNALRLQQYADIPLQEYLDRADKHGIILFFKGMDGNGNYISVDVQINGWLIRKQEVDGV